MPREPFDENILDDGPEMMLVDQAADERLEAEADLEIGLIEIETTESLLDETEKEINNFYVSSDE